MDRKAVQMAKAAVMYYIDNMSQKDISNILGISRPTVCRVLEQARQSGIVQICINLPIIRCEEAERELCRRFGFMDAVVIVQPSIQEANISKNLGRACAQYILSQLRNNMVVGISMGHTLMNAALQLRDLAPKEHHVAENVTFVSVIGGSGNTDPSCHSNEICHTMARAVNGKSVPLYAPAVAETVEQKQQFMRSNMLLHGLEMANNADITLISLGSLDYHSHATNELISKREIEHMKRIGIKGDMCAKFFDANGDFTKASINKRVVGVELSSPRNCSKKILVAGGKSKQEAIKAIVGAGFLNGLITDENTANYLLKI
ncbi:MAG: sugar-binding transcriptional regulator [Eubacteriales bacterium]|nr:sugar-binding transcriptional regulator [Eubacteriales bacterium]